jgi:hypothetical protein
MPLSNDEKRAILEDIVGDDAVVAYLIGGSDEDFAVYPDRTELQWDVGREIAEDERPATYLRCPGDECFLEFTEAEGFEPLETEYGEPTYTHPQDELYDAPRVYTLTECVGYKVEDDADFRERLIDALLENWD